MKRIILFLLLSFSWMSLTAQPGRDHRSLDRHARRAPAALQEDLSALVAYLVEAAESEEEKARVIYVWITEHIRYDETAYRAGRGRINRSNADILRRGQAVCFGYATLFRDMCVQAGLTAEVISGYSKGTLTAAPGLAEVDHAWNAVQLDGEWRLLDATWGSSVVQKENNFVQVEAETYWLTSPERFVLNHLPSQPMWQLLDCPITPATFRQSPAAIQAALTATEPCFYYADSIRRWRVLPPSRRRLESARTAFRYHPTAANRNELGHSYFDYAGTLSDRAEVLQADGALDSLIRVQEAIIAACSRGWRYAAQRYDWQTELYVNVLINQAVARYQAQALETPPDPEKVQATYATMQRLLSQALELLDELPPDSFYARQVRAQCRSYLEMVEEEGAN